MEKKLNMNSKNKEYKYEIIYQNGEYSIVFDEFQNKIGISKKDIIIFYPIEEWFNLGYNENNISNNKFTKSQGNIPLPLWNPHDRNERFIDKMKNMNEDKDKENIKNNKSNKEDINPKKKKSLFNFWKK